MDGKIEIEIFRSGRDAGGAGIYGLTKSLRHMESKILSSWLFKQCRKLMTP